MTTTTKARESSDYLHLVISPRSKPDPLPLVNYLIKKSIHYIVSIEYGEQGSHPHLESFFQLKKEMRKDNFKKTILRMYSDLTEEERKNVKVSINHIDTDPRYGYGYSYKESPTEYYTDLSVKYLEECVEYYHSRKEEVQKVKESIKKSHKKDSQISVDRVFRDLVKYLYSQLPNHNNMEDPIIHQYVDNDGRERGYSKVFHRFYIELPYTVPHSVYSRINQKTIVFHAHQEIMRLENQKRRAVS